MTKIKKHDFIEITYTGSLMEDGTVFDTTNETLAKDQEIYNEHGHYGPIVICVGKKQMIAGLDRSLVGKEPNIDYKIELRPEDAFGKKDAKLIQLVSTSKFIKEKISPMPGMQVNIDGIFGMIKTVSGGRTLVDFNHPLAGKEIVYNVRISKIITSDIDKIKSIIEMKTQVDKPIIEIKDGIATIKIKEEMPEEIQIGIKQEIMELIDNIKEIKFLIINEEESKKS